MISSKKGQDMLFGCAVILVSAAFYTQLRSLSPGASLFPRAILTVMFLSGILITVSAALTKENGNGYFTAQAALRELGVPAVVLIVCCGLFRALGFYICSFLLVFLISCYEEYLEKRTIGRKFFLFPLLLSSCVTVMMYLIFAVFLHLPTPTGLLGI